MSISSMTVKQLKAVCKKRNIKGCYKLRKSDLIKLLSGKAPKAPRKAKAAKKAAKKVKKTVAQLKKECRTQGIKGCSKLRKAELLDVLGYGAPAPMKAKAPKKAPKKAKKTVAQLKKECRTQGIKGCSKLRKAELLDVLGYGDTPVPRKAARKPSKKAARKPYVAPASRFKPSKFDSPQSLFDLQLNKVVDDYMKEFGVVVYDRDSHQALLWIVYAAAGNLQIYFVESNIIPVIKFNKGPALPTEIIPYESMKENLQWDNRNFIVSNDQAKRFTDLVIRPLIRKILYTVKKRGLHEKQEFYDYYEELDDWIKNEYYSK